MKRGPGQPGYRDSFTRLGPPLAEKFMDTGNLVLGGLVVAQFFSAGGFDWRLAVVGVAIWASLFGAAGWLLYSVGGEK